MNLFNPYSYVSLNGQGTMRGVTLEVPSEDVRRLLPHGLELGDQDVTRPGTHPLVCSFNDMLRAHMSIPTLLPSLSYHELILGVPFTYVTYGTSSLRGLGPYYYMPRLYLDSFLATLGGRLYWGYDKQLASFTVDAERYVVRAQDGSKLTSLDFRPVGQLQPIAAYPYFEPIRRMLDQPLVSLMPGGLGPLFVCSNFDKQWELATMRPLETITEIAQAYVPGLEVGRWPAHERSAGIHQAVLGAYDLRAPWRVSLPYPPMAAGLVGRL